MQAKKPKPAKAKRAQDPKDAQAYDHEEKLLLRPDVGLQSQFKQKKPPKTYRYDPSLDPGPVVGRERRPRASRSADRKNRAGYRSYRGEACGRRTPADVPAVS